MRLITGEADKSIKMWKEDENATPGKRRERERERRVKRGRKRDRHSELLDVFTPPLSI